MASRAKLQAEAKLRAEQENRNIMEKRLAEAGLAHVDQEMAYGEDDGVAEKSHQTILKSFLGMIPWTSAWYESRAAEKEMDDFQAMKNELAKANDLLAMTTIGRHEEALSDMMAETNNDYFFFNKLKHKMVEDKSYKFEIPNLNKYAYLERGNARNRLKKGHNAKFAVIDEAMAKLLASATKKISHEKVANTIDTICNWRGKNKEGERLVCNNKVRATFIKNVPQEYHDKCMYHITNCQSEEHHATETIIKIPNEDTLCTECFLNKRKSKPLALVAEYVPGVGPYVSALEANKVAKGVVIEVNNNLDNNGKELTEKTLCCWRPPADEVEKRAWICKNPIMKNPDTDEWVKFCPYHQKKCIRLHVNGPGQINNPNEYGLCDNHHTADHGIAPPPLEFPLPGMELKNSRDGWKIKAGFWNSPNWRPDDDVDLIEYFYFDTPENIFEEIQLWTMNHWRAHKYKNRVKKIGEITAIKIQTWFRKYRIYNNHLKLWAISRVKLRNKSSIVIQCLVRRFICSNYMRIRREKILTSTCLLQRIYRGFIIRRRLLVAWASKRITKLFKKLNFFKFKDMVITVLQLGKLMKKRLLHITNIQRVYRGHLSRKLVLAKRLWLFITNRNSKKIQRCYRDYCSRKVKPKFIYPDNNWVKKNLAKKLANMICEMYLDQKNRRKFIVTLTQSAPQMQRLIRAFISKRGAGKMKLLRQSLQTWCQPEFAQEFFTKFLYNNVKYYMKPETPVVNTIVKKEVILPYFLTPLVPEHVRAHDMHQKEFIPILIQWYKVINVPLLQSEQDSIIKRFKNPQTGRFNVVTLDIYIAGHPLPCRKHGRKVCGDCICYTKCAMPKCTCKRFIVSESGVCKCCMHPCTLHKLCPKQVVEKNKKEDFLGMLAESAAKEIDMTKPNNDIVGITLDDIIPPPVDYEVLRYESETLQKTKALATTIKEANSMTLTRSLKNIDLSGGEMEDNDEYWESYKMNLVKPSIDAVQSVDISAYTVPPHYDITENEFWNAASKIPNKNPRDYNEYFEHSMPMPIVESGELMYTIEGPKMYLNVLVEIIKNEETIHYDDSTFLRLIMDHIQIFERHWRKMVADLRTGKLSRYLTISEKDRVLYETTSIPRPALASRLDATFRELGFHKKVLGKDIKLVKFAELRHKPLPNPRKRRPSLPVTPGHSNSFGLESSASFLSSQFDSGIFDRTIASRTGSRLDTGKGSPRKGSPSKTGSPSRTSRNGSPSKGTRGSSRGGSSLSPTRTGSRIGSSTSTRSLLTSPDGSFSGDNDTHDIYGDDSTFELNRSLASPSRGSRSSKKKKKTQKELLIEVGETMRDGGLKDLHEAQVEHDIRGPSRRSRLDGRRGSESDIAIPLTMSEVQTINHDSETQSRGHYHLAIKMHGGRYICPFPACGKSFKSKEVAFAHLPEHEQRKRLHAPTPLPDSHMNYYWPSGVPWLVNPAFTQRSLPPGAVSCPMGDCKEQFPSQDRLESHIRIYHSKSGPSSQKRGYFVLSGSAVNVPPFEPPPEAPIKFCAIHQKPIGRCPVCIEIEKINGPKQPFKIYQTVTIDLCKKTGKSPDPLQVFSLNHLDEKFGVVVREHHNNNYEYKAQFVSMLLDVHQNCWVAVNKLHGYNEALLKGIKLFNDYDAGQELIRPVDKEAAEIRWIPINDVVGKFHIRFMSKFNYKEGLKDRTISKVNSFFVRTPGVVEDGSDIIVTKKRSIF
jgi:hypothetical protein